MDAIKKFRRDREGWLVYRENPISINVWKCRPFGEPAPEPSVYEYNLHFGLHQENTGTFKTEEDACEDALKRSVQLLELAMGDIKRSWLT